MRQGQGWPLLHHERKQLRAAPSQSPHLEESVFTVVAPNPHALHAQSLRHLANLKSVASGYDHRMTAPFELANYRLEKRNVRGVIKINPDFHRLQIRFKIGTKFPNVRNTSADFVPVNSQWQRLSVDFHVISMHSGCLFSFSPGPHIRRARNL
jgi:hypothetical protein